MKKVMIVLAAAFFTAQFANAQGPPAKVKNYLDRNYPQWQISGSFVVDSPVREKRIVTGDFNGDKKTDYAVVLSKGERIYAIALLGTRNSFTAVNLAAQKNGWIAGIGLAAKGQRVFLSESGDGSSGKYFVLKHDAISLYDGEGMSQVFYWQGGRFLSANEY